MFRPLRTQESPIVRQHDLCSKYRQVEHKREDHEHDQCRNCQEDEGTQPLSDVNEIARYGRHHQRANCVVLQFV